MDQLYRIVPDLAYSSMTIEEDQPIFGAVRFSLHDTVAVLIVFAGAPQYRRPDHHPSRTHRPGEEGASRPPRGHDASLCFQQRARRQILSSRISRGNTSSTLFTQARTLAQLVSTCSGHLSPPVGAKALSEPNSCRLYMATTLRQ